MPYAVIFDVDGTLVDSNDLHAACWVEAFNYFGCPVAFDDVRRQIGKGGDQLMPAVLPPDLLKQKGQDIEAFRSALFTRKYLAQVQPFPGVKPLFEKIRSDGVRIVLASSGRGAEVDRHIQTLGIENLIEAATTSDDAESSKPEPDIFQAALEKLPSANVEATFVVGDTPYDAQGASKAKLKTIGLLCGGFPEEDLREAGCISIFRDPQDLLDNYNRSPLRATASR